MAKFNILMTEEEEIRFWENMDNYEEIVPQNSFFKGIRGCRINEHIESADNRRSADVYINNF